MINFNAKSLIPLCAGFDFELTSEAAERLEIYGNMLLEWNEKFNLTAITEPEEVLYKHFYDCLLFFSAVPVQKNAKIIDIGAGAGFPSLVLKIARPDIDITMLDGLNKRITFLNAVLSELGLNGTAEHLRAEEAGGDERYRERFDIACARAVASLNVLSEYCAPFVKPGGIFVSMKSGVVLEEAEGAKNAFKLLGLDKPEIIFKTLRENEKRSFIIAKKISQTPPKYPRTSAKIKKAAL